MCSRWIASQRPISRAIASLGTLTIFVNHHLRDGRQSRSLPRRQGYPKQRRVHAIRCDGAHQTLECVGLKSSAWTTTAGRGLPV